VTLDEMATLRTGDKVWYRGLTFSGYCSPEGWAEVIRVTPPNPEFAGSLGVVTLRLPDRKSAGLAVICLHDNPVDNLARTYYSLTRPAVYKVGDRVVYETRPWVFMKGRVIEVEPERGPGDVSRAKVQWDGIGEPMWNDQSELVRETV
jgi:hypothetical protein